MQLFGSLDVCLLSQIFWYVAFILNPCAFNDAWSGADEEAFEDNSEEYIIRDLEGSGTDLIESYFVLYGEMKTCYELYLKMQSNL